MPYEFSRRRLQKRLQFLAHRERPVHGGAAGTATVQDEVDPGVTETLANDPVLDGQQAVIFAAETESQTVEEAKSLDHFERRFQVGNAVYRPVANHRADDVRVISVQPIREPVALVGETLRRIDRAESRNGSEIGLELGERAFGSPPALVVDTATRAHVLPKQRFKSGMRETVGRKVGRNFGVDANTLRAVQYRDQAREQRCGAQNSD